MIYPMKRPSEQVTAVRRTKNSLVLTSEYGKLRLSPKTMDIIGISFTRETTFSTEKKPGVVLEGVFDDWKYTDMDEEVILTTPKLELKIDKKTMAISYYDTDGKLLLKEKGSRGKTLEAYDAYKVDTQMQANIQTTITPDGEKKRVREAVKIYDRKLYHCTLHMQWQEDEALYGLGQHEEGNLNLRGKTVYLHQANMKIAVPLLNSSFGYGILLDSYGPVIFNDNEFGSYMYAEADIQLDYYFIYGGTMDGVVRGYRELTGKAVMLPKWAFGFVQSQERYESQEEILQTVQEYRKRGLGLDCIVLDWLSWEEGLWGQKTFDSSRFPNPKEMIRQLHDMKVHFMISIWPNMDEKSENYQEFAQHKDWMLPFSTIYNAVNPQARKLYWEQVNRGLFSQGVDAWWCDSSEPFCPEWEHLEKPSPANMYKDYIDTASQQMPLQLGNAYALYHSQTLYEGQRSVTDQKRVVNLTRSGYIGSQRYGAILWSGDTTATWETLQKQIPAGLNFCASGMPYWTLDIGGFFVKNGIQWYWNGDYEDGCDNLAFRELYVRWYQYGCFLPVFRAHGTDTRRELWNYGEQGEETYEALVKMNKIRYQIMPYIYSAAGNTWRNNDTIMRMLAFDYPQDYIAREVKDQYLFGESLMVCPVVTPLYYDEDGSIMENIEKVRAVYLPNGNDWYDFWTGDRYSGGQQITASATLDTIPIYVKAGSIIPMGEPLEYAAQKQDKPLTLRVYTGRDTVYELYEDAGEGYEYEQGKFTITQIHWNDREKTLKIIRKDEVVSQNEFNIQII